MEAPELLARTLSDRHKGVGGDGVILICPSETADAKMRMFNADGSEGRMCGNGVRCVAEYLFRHGYASGTAADVETLSGVKHIVRREPGLLTVDMGAPELAPEKIPVTGFAKPVVNELVEVNGGAVRMTCVSMGNPHCVVSVSYTHLDVYKRQGMCWSRRSPSTKCSRDGGRIFPAAGKKKSCRGRRSSISHLSKKRSA